MFYENLINIKRQLNLSIPSQVLEKLDLELTILKPEAIISPHYLSRKARIPLSIIETILVNLAYKKLLDVKYLIYCNNDDPEMVHGFEYISKKELRDFIAAQKFSCPNCNSNLNTQNIRVAFVKKELIHTAL